MAERHTPPATDWIVRPDPQSPVAVWRQIRDSIAAALASGALPPGSRLPGEIELAQLYGVARTTLRRALAELQTGGALVSQRGVGLYSRAAPRRFTVDANRRFSEGLAEGHVTTRLLLLEECSLPPDLRRRYPQADAGSWHHLIRLRIVDDVPLYLVEKYLPAARLPDLPEIYTSSGSVAAVYRAAGIEAWARGPTRISCRFATESEAQALRLSPGAPVLVQDTINFCPAGGIIELSQGLWPAMAAVLEFPPVPLENRI